VSKGEIARIYSSQTESRRRCGHSGFPNCDNDNCDNTVKRQHYCL